MIERIKNIIRKEGLNAGSFADEIGVQRSSLSHILNGRNNPSLDFVIKTLSRFPNISPQWLLMGKGEMYAVKPVADKSDVKYSDGQDLFSSVIRNGNEAGASEDEDIPLEEPDNEKVELPKPERYVSQILIFYSDSTYQVYKPEK